MISRQKLILGVALLGTQVLCAAEVPALKEYAYGFPILLPQPAQQQTDFNSIEIPLLVYQSVTDPRLRDIGIYNAAGQPVPRVIRPREQQSSLPETATTLRLFALPGSDATSAEDIRVMLRRGDATTDLQINAAGGADDKQQRYLVVTENLKRPLTALEFDWHSVTETFVATVNVEGSQNLDDWVPIGSGAIAHLLGPAGDVRRQRVRLNGSRHDYLRINVTDTPQNWRLSSTQGIQLAKAATAERRWTSLDADGQDEDGGVLFDLGGSVPIDRLQVRLSSNNAVVRGTLYYWSGTRWVDSYEGVFYNLRRNGAGVANEPIAITQRSSQRWKLKIITGRSDGPIQLKLGWQPENLVFLAQGDGPFTLAAGRAADKAEGFPQARLYGDLAIFNLALNSDVATVATASLGSRQSLGGADKLAIPVERNWRQLLLWAVLILAVVVVAAIAVNLLRQLNSAEP